MKSEYSTICLTSFEELENCRTQGILAFWEELLASDPTANFFQGPVWCLPWYRNYSDVYEPLVLVIQNAQGLMGVVPLARSRKTKEVIFAGGFMSDYCDVVARPGFRTTVLKEFLALYKQSGSPKPLRLGYVQPESETPVQLLSLTKENGLSSVVTLHPCYRFIFKDPVETKKLTRKESVRRRLSYYKRQGEIEFRRITSLEEWNDLKSKFYDQHTLRQLYVNRPVSFDDHRKRSFYEDLFTQHPESVHIVVLFSGARMLAAHYGIVWRKMLYWGAPSFDVTEEKYSPGQVLLALLIQEAEVSDLCGVDLTIGAEEFKRRFGNTFVELPLVEIYASRVSYLARIARRSATRIAKSLICKWKGEKSWEDLRDFLGAETAEVTLSSVMRALSQKANFEKSQSQLFVTRLSEPNAPAIASARSLNYSENAPSDLLNAHVREPTLNLALGAVLRKVPDMLAKNGVLHIVLENGSLAGFCFSRRSSDDEWTRVSGSGTGSSPGTLVIENLRIVSDGQFDEEIADLLLKRILANNHVTTGETILLSTSQFCRRWLRKWGFTKSNRP